MKVIHGITHILNLANNQCREHFPGELIYVDTDAVFNKDQQQFLANLACGFAFIGNTAHIYEIHYFSEVAKESHGVCLMHCKSGRSVSAAVCRT